MTSRPDPLPLFLGDHFSVRDARAAGLSASRLRAGDLEAPFRGVRMLRHIGDLVSELPDFAHGRADTARILARVFSYAQIMPAHALFTHVTAAVVWEIPVPLRAHPARARANESGHRDLDVGVFPPYRASRAAGVRGASLHRSLVSVREHRGVRVSSPASTWASLGAELTVDELIVAGDAIVRIPRLHGGRRGEPDSALGTIAQLAAALSAGRRIGAAKLNEALGSLRVGSASPPESDLRIALIRAGLPEPELDIDIIGAKGELIGCTEIAYPQWRILIEYEGDHHRVSREQWNRDIDKHARCAALGWTVLRITSSHLYPSASRAVAQVRAALERAGWRP